MKQRGRVQAAGALRREDAVRQPHPVCADDLGRGRVPNEQMRVDLIESVQVQAVPCALAFPSKAQFPQPADLFEDAGQFVRARRVNTIIPRLREHSVLR